MRKTYRLLHRRGWYGFCDNGPCNNELRLESGCEVVLYVTLDDMGGHRCYCSEACMRVLDADAVHEGGA